MTGNSSDNLNLLNPEKAAQSLLSGSPDASKLNLVDVSHTQPAEAPKKEEPKAATPPPTVKKDANAWDITAGFAKGMWNEGSNMVNGALGLFANVDAGAIRRAAISGKDPSTDTSVNIFGSLGRTANDMGTSFNYIRQQGLGNVTSQLVSRTADQWNKADGAGKAEMAGHFTLFAGTLGLGGYSAYKGFRGSRVLSEAGELSTLSRETRIASEIGDLSRMSTLSRDSRLASEVTALGRVGEGGVLARNTSFLSEASMIGRDGKLMEGAAALSADGTLLRTPALTELKFLKTGTAVEDLAAANRSSRTLSELTGMTRLGEGEQAGIRLQNVVGGLGKNANALREAELLAGEGRFGELAGTTSKADALLAQRELQTAGGTILDTTTLAREAQGASATTREAKLLNDQIRALEESVQAARTATTVESRLVAARELETNIAKYNEMISSNPLIKGRAAELRIGELQGSSSGIVTKLDEAKALSTAGRTGEASELALKAQQVETNLAKVSTAEDAAAQARALQEFRTSVAQYNAALESTPATAAKASELKIADSSVLQFEKAAKEASELKTLTNTQRLVSAETTAAELRTASEASRAAQVESKVQPISSRMEEANRLATTTRTEEAARVTQTAAEVEANVARVRTAENIAAHDRAAAELQTSIRQYNAALEQNAATKAAAQNLRIEQEHVTDLLKATRQDSVVREVVGNNLDLRLVHNATAMRTGQLESHAQQFTQRLDQVTAFATGPNAPANAQALLERARAVEGSIAFINSGSGNVREAFAGLRSNVRAYNELIGSSFPEARAAELRINPGSIKQYHELATDVDRLRRTETGIITDMGKRIAAGEQTVPRYTRVDGLIRDQFRYDVLRTSELVETRTRNYLQALVGTAVFGYSTYYGSAALADRIATMSREHDAQVAKQQAEAQKAKEAVETPQQQKADGSVNPQQSGQSAQRASAEVSSQAMFSAPGSQGRELTPAMQVFGLPKASGQTMPSAAYLERHELTPEELRKKKNWGQEWKDWFGGNPIYRYAAPEAPQAEQSVRQIAPPPRVVSNNDGSQRVVTPVFDPRYIRMQSDLLGTSQNSRLPEGRMAALGSDPTARRIRGGATRDDKQPLTAQYPFLRPAGETGMASNRTVFKLNNVEDREGAKTEAPSAQSGGAPINPTGGIDPAPAMAASATSGTTNQDPNATATAQQS